MINTKTLLQVFIIGSSILSTAITQLYIAIPNNKKKVIKNIDFMGLGIPIIFGIAVVIAYVLYKTVKYLKRFIFLIVGAAFGIMLATGGTSMELPTKLFNFTAENQALVFPIAMTMYATLFEFGIKNLLLYLL